MSSKLFNHNASFNFNDKYFLPLPCSMTVCDSILSCKRVCTTHVRASKLVCASHDRSKPVCNSNVFSSKPA